MTPEYNAWNAALLRRFLQGQASDPLYLYTDETVLEEVATELGIDPDRAVTSFADAVRGTLGSHREPFRRWALEARRPVPEIGPSYLAVLCFLVLVAVESETTHFQYYPGLNRLLRRDEAGAPPGFDVHVPLLFRTFNEWLEGPGAVHGTVTASPHPNFPNVGWPLSQAVVRPADRALMVRLFSAAGLVPGGGSNGAAIRARIVPRLRMSAESPARTRLLHLLSEQPALLEASLLREYAAWDGSEAVRVGPVRVRARLCFDEAYGEWWFTTPKVAGTAGKTWRLGTASGTVPAFKGLEATPAELWELVGSGRVGSIADGPDLLSVASQVRWLSLDVRVGGWAEVPGRDTKVEQLALVRDGRTVPGLEGLLEQAGAPIGWRLLKVPAGLTTDGEPGAEIEDARPMLEGGLLLDPSSKTYLLSPHGLPRLVNVSTAAAADGMPLDLVDGRVALSSVITDEGSHVLTADGEKFPVRVYRSLRASADNTYEAEGAWWQDLAPSMRVRLPGSHEHVWLLGTSGEAERRAVRPCAWVRNLDLMDNEADVTGLLRSTWFEPAYVIAPNYMGRPWVEKVPQGIAEAQESEEKRQLSVVAARELVSLLLVDYGPDTRKLDSSWKRCLAAFLRTAHR